MKRIILLLVALPVICNIAHPQDIVEVCGTQNITLRADNYQYGTMRWEWSSDNVNWETIAGANDTVYTFIPDRDTYVRAVVSFSMCPPEYSETAFVKMPPKANAGFDRVSPGREIRLTANTSAGAEGVWQIIAGAGGSLSDSNKPYALFQGTDSLYTLVWMLTNACGTDTDTLSIRFRQNEYIESLAIVDDTDQIISDSLQMEEGLYIIHFSDPAPVITEETILVGITQGGFLRKVESFTVDGDTYSIQTSQANLEDITINGAYNLAFAFEVDAVIGPEKMHRGMTRLHEKPTRRELTTNPRYKNGIYYYISEEEPAYIHPGVFLTKSDEDEEITISLTFERTLLEDSGVSLTLNGGYSFTPNFVADLEYSDLNLEYFRMGLSNAKAVRSVDLTLSASVTALSLEKTFTLLSIKRDMIFVIGTVPLLITAGFSIEGEATASVGASMDISQGFTNTTFYDAYIKYIDNKWGYVFTEDSSTETNSSLQIKGSIEQHFEIGPRLSLTVYRIVGPYIDLRLEQDFELCTDFNFWQTNMNIGGSLTLGAKAEILSWTLIDISRKWTQGFYHYQFPHKLEIVSGNNQLYIPGGELVDPVRVRARSNKGLILPGARIKFEPQDGGSVTQSMATADAGGYAETTWTPGGAEFSTLKIISMNCDSENISLSPMLVNAYASNQPIDCSRSSLSVSIEKSGQTIRPKAHMGYPPYTYSTDGENYFAQIPELETSIGHTYFFFVKDVADCMASASWTEQSEFCRTSGLLLDLETIGNTVVASAKGGRPPYLFAIDDHQDDHYSSQHMFVNVPVGQHIVYAKDADGCVHAQATFVFREQHPNCGVIVDSRDGNIYNTVLIGHQCWMAENLRYLPEVTGPKNQWNSYSEPRYAVPEYYGPENSVDDARATDNYRHYGVLYNWVAAMADSSSSDSNPHGTQGACPSGWHIPSHNEWLQLKDFVVDQGYLNDDLDDLNGAGNALKSCRQENSPLGGNCATQQHPRWMEHSKHYGTDAFGFSALPAGFRSHSGYMIPPGIHAFWWSSHSLVWTHYMMWYYGSFPWTSENKSEGYSVRCIRD